MVRCHGSANCGIGRKRYVVFCSDVRTGVCSVGAVRVFHVSGLSCDNF